MFGVFEFSSHARMQFDQVLPSLLIGSCPQSAEDAEILAARGVTAILNLQMDEDMRMRGVNWSALSAYYRKIGIDCRRTPIRDFDEDDLADKLPAAVAVLKELLDVGHRVYVHCTAGMGRSAAVIVAFFCRHGNKSPEEALEALRRRRPVVCPNMNAVRRAGFFKRFN